MGQRRQSKSFGTDRVTDGEEAFRQGGRAKASLQSELRRRAALNRTEQVEDRRQHHAVNKPRRKRQREKTDRPEILE